MGKINILDCTLRDGGYVNDWCFGKDAITGLLDKMSLANVECVEVGFLRDVTYDENRSLFPDKTSHSFVQADGVAQEARAGNSDGYCKE